MKADRLGKMPKIDQKTTKKICLLIFHENLHMDVHCMADEFSWIFATRGHCCMLFFRVSTTFLNFLYYYLFSDLNDDLIMIKTIDQMYDFWDQNYAWMHTKWHFWWLYDNNQIDPTCTIHSMCALKKCGHYSDHVHFLSSLINNWSSCAQNCA